MSTADPKDSGARVGRVWFALLFPLIAMFGVFMSVGAYLAVTQGLRGDEIGKRIEAFAFYPAAVVFLLVFAVTAWLARKDGLRLRELGWRRPQWQDLALGVGVTVVLVAANHWIFHPLVRLARPDFDPTIPALGGAEAVILQLFGVAAEDTVYRGYALKRLPERYALPVAFVISMVAYASLSLANGLAVVAWSLVLGAVFNVMFLKRGNLWSVAIAHYFVALVPRWLT